MKQSSPYSTNWGTKCSKTQQVTSVPQLSTEGGWVNWDLGNKEPFRWSGVSRDYLHTCFCGYGGLISAFRCRDPWICMETRASSLQLFSALIFELPEILFPTKFLCLVISLKFRLYRTQWLNSAWDLWKQGFILFTFNCVKMTLECIEKAQKVLNEFKFVSMALMFFA